jgi:hypothetical protein
VAAVTIDRADPRATARFWGQAMDWTLHQVTGDHAVLRSAQGVGPYLQFLRTPDLKTVKNRVHLDLRPYPGDDQAAEVARLRALGATDIDLGQGDVSWTCLADPEGNEVDVLTPRLREPVSDSPRAVRGVWAPAPSTGNGGNVKERLCPFCLLMPQPGMRPLRAGSPPR